MSNDSLGDRMKGYENINRVFLPRRLPMILRVDGKAFHTYTQGLKPFDPNLAEVMNHTAIKLCEEIQGAQFAYVQSDEISILIHDYKKLTSEPWFAKNVQKMVSVSAAIASVEFTGWSWKIWNGTGFESNSFYGATHPAYFDSRAFVLPESEVTNYFLWRQQDWTRNSLQMFARQFFSHKQLENKNSGALLFMCENAGHMWSDLTVAERRGRGIVRNESGKWTIDNNIPVLSQDRIYIDKFLTTDDNNEETKQEI